MKKYVIYYIGILFIVISILAVYLNKAIFYSRDYAKKIAYGEVDKYMKRKKLDSAFLTGPSEISINTAWGFSWVYNNKNETIIIGVNIYNSGVTEIYTDTKRI